MSSWSPHRSPGKQEDWNQKKLKSAEFSESTNKHEAHAAHMICTTIEFSRYEPKQKYDGGHGVSDRAIREPYVVTTWTHAVQLVPLNFLEWWSWTD